MYNVNLFEFTLQQYSIYENYVVDPETSIQKLEKNPAIETYAPSFKNKQHVFHKLFNRERVLTVH